MSGRKVRLGAFMASRAGSIDPSRYPDEEFDLYSIPAFDAGRPDVLHGRSIGSSKQIVEPDDVLLSRIVPHIRRAWVVGQGVGRRIIASNEWIVFKSPEIHPPYLRHLLLGDEFRAAFMRTVSGVGGSLLRARPAHVSSIEVVLPSISAQRRFAKILDTADALRAKRRAALAQLDALTQSIFLDMFGDPVANPKRVPTTRLGDICTRITDGTHQPPAWSPTGNPFLFVSNIIHGEITFDTQKYISDDTYAELTRRCPIDVGDVLYSTVGSYGVPAVVTTARRFAFQRHIAHLKPDRSVIEPEFLRVMLASPPLKRQADRAARGVAQKTINLSDIREFLVFKPSLEMQRDFSRRAAVVGRLSGAHQASLIGIDALFASLQHRAFRGEL